MQIFSILAIYIFAASASPAVRSHPRKPLDHDSTLIQHHEPHAAGYTWRRRMYSRKRDYPPPNLPALKILDDGNRYGNVIIVNNCEEQLYLHSVGAWYVNGTSGDDDTTILAPNATHSEPYRVTCFDKKNGNWDCEAQNKLGGQGVSIKLSRNDKDWSNVAQIEYALGMNPENGDHFKRLYYDISFLDCGAPEDIFIKDSTAKTEQNQKKLDQCPGYKGGVSVMFDGDSNGTNCMPIWCDSDMQCPMVYMWDRTRPKEASFQCEREYRANMRVELCANRGQNRVDDRTIFDSYTATAAHEVISAFKSATRWGPNSAAEPTPAPNTETNVITTVTTTTITVTVTGSTPSSQTSNPTTTQSIRTLTATNTTTIMKPSSHADSTVLSSMADFTWPKSSSNSPSTSTESPPGTPSSQASQLKARSPPDYSVAPAPAPSASKPPSSSRSQNLVTTTPASGRKSSTKVITVNLSPTPLPTSETTLYTTVSAL
ncbi:unnamed protein product [Periconia digitata]|uniref:Uncharacterized protein n=1 Tax=Periconia digitata TaxID=1303443 RepID=A0A9W4UGY7_9PLEO|nr:unnamed protein product [Periconia digitata]